MIHIKNLYKSFFHLNKKIPVLQDINLNISSGEIVALMGQSGAGKSTLLNILGLLDHYDSGEFFINQQLIKKLSEDEATPLRNKFTGFIFQRFNLIPFKSALDNITLPLFYRGASSQEQKTKALAMLAKMNLLSHAHHFPPTLSGGQQQRVAIARALVTNAPIILADEPTGALDSNTAKEIMQLLIQINHEGKTIIIVTYDEEVAKKCNRIIHIKDGYIV